MFIPCDPNKRRPNLRIDYYVRTPTGFKPLTRT